MDRTEIIRTIIFTKLKKFYGGGILPTTRCSTGCRHCIYGDVKKEDMEKETIEKGLNILKGLKLDHIGISGGEPFEAYDNLVFTAKKILEFLPPERLILITSVNWAKTEQITKEKLNPLLKIGVERFVISIDSFHIEKIDLNNYFLAFDYLNSKGIVPLIAIRYDNEIEKNKDFFKTIKRKYNTMIFTKRISRAGNAKSLQEKIIDADSKGLMKFRKEIDCYQNKMVYNFRPKCLQPTLFPNGDIHICCVKQENTKICNINTDDFYQSLKEFNKNWKKNIYRGLKNPIDYTNCDRCVISK